MIPEPPAADFTAYLRDSICILQSAVRHYQAGDIAFYRLAALQLRLLLCDTVRRHGRVEDISLLPRVHPACALPPVLPDGHPASADPLPLSAWLMQPLSGADGSVLTIRDLIRRVCDQDGGAHVDPKPQAGLAAFPCRQELIIRLAVQVCSWFDPAQSG